MVGDKAGELSSRQVVKITHSKKCETDSLTTSERGVSASSFEECILLEKEE